MENYQELDEKSSVFESKKGFKNLGLLLPRIHHTKDQSYVNCQTIDKANYF